MRILFRLIFWGLFIGLGWIFGAKWGAPAYVTDTFDRVVAFGANTAREKAADVSDELADVDFSEVAGALADDLEKGADGLQQGAEELLRQFEEANEVPDDVASSNPEAAAATDGSGASGVSGSSNVTASSSAGLKSGSSSTDMKLCLTNISNAPASTSDGTIRNFKKSIRVNGVSLLVAPATKSCLSSGFGPRGSSGRIHEGVDYYTKENGDVLAAGAGTIVEAEYRDDYGYMVIVDHGSGVYTRSAHLKRLARGVSVGKAVAQGDILGPIGMSGAYTSVVHLHYEILTGDYNTPKKSFGLTAVDPYSF